MLISTFASTLASHTAFSFVRGAIVLFVAMGGLNSVFAGPAEDTKEAARLYQQGKYDLALAKVNAVLVLQPKDAQGRFLKGLIYTEQKRSADAIQIFTGLTEDYPELPEPYNNLAVLYASQGSYDKARAALELAIHTHPSYATAYENLGDIYAQLARRSYDKVLQLDKTNVSAQSKLAMVKDLFNPPTKSLAPDATKVATATNTTPPALPIAATKTEPTKMEPAKPAPTVTAAVDTSKLPAKPAPTKGATPEAQVTNVVNDWAKAWAGKDVARYLAYYAPDFETPDGLTRAAWEEQRKSRIERPGTIQVDVKIGKIATKGNEATVTFRQAYQWGTVKSSNSKTLKLVKSGDNWLIRSERAAGAK